MQAHGGSQDRAEEVGRLELFGFSAPAGGLLIAGRMPRRVADELASGEFIVRFGSGEVQGRGCAGFYPRETAGEDGLGAIVFVALAERPRGRPTALTTVTGKHRFTVPAQENIREFAAEAPPKWLARALRQQLRPQFPDVLVDALLPGSAKPTGAVDAMVYDAALGGWLIAGSVALPEFADGETTLSCSLAGAARILPALAVAYPRPDLKGRGTGVVLFARLASGAPVEPRDMTVTPGAATVPLERPEGLRVDGGAAIVRDIRARVERAADSPARAALLRRLATPAFAGNATLASLSDFVRIGVGRAIFCPPDGVVLKGWVLALAASIREVRLCSGGGAVPVDLAAAVRISRPDIIESAANEHGFDDPMCGFTAFVPHGYSAAGPSYLAVETICGEIAFATLPAPRLQGLAAIREVLGCAVQYSDVAPAFASVLGPSVARLHAARRAEPPRVTTIEFGEAPQAPMHTIVVPLYRRLDFIELQFALFSRDPAVRHCELIYVLDDPPRRVELERLAASIYERFRIPFAIAAPDRNMGFAAACNIGLDRARGHHVCFLNSDVFPHTVDWLPRLTARLAERPDLGVVGPLLLFEDGSVQHQGMTWRQDPQFGNWFFNEHPGIGRRPPAQAGLLECPAITGACMVLRSDAARAVGGFDEDYVVGDYEDSDLCLKLREKGLGSAVDLAVRACHLVRKSQPSSQELWRLNLTLYNARLQHRRWEPAIRAALEPASHEPHTAGQPAMVA